MEQRLQQLEEELQQIRIHLNNLAPLAARNLLNRIINLLMVITAAIGIAYFLVPVLESGCEQIVQQKLVYELEKGIEDLKELQEKLLAKFSRDNLAKQEETFPICPGSIANQPASSCQQILSCGLSSSSGYYWIASADGNATEMYCSMNRVCGGVSGGGGVDEGC